MNANGPGIIGMTAASGVVNGYAAYKNEGADAIPKIAISNATLLLTFLGVGQWLDWQLALLLTILYFMGTMFTNGLPFLEFITDLVG